MAGNPYDLAKELHEVDGIDGVRACSRRITVVHAPDDRYTEQIPESVHDAIHDIISGTMWQTEYRNPGCDAERHSWSGRSNPVLPRSEQPAGYELQYHLVE